MGNESGLRPELHQGGQSGSRKTSPRVCCTMKAAPTASVNPKGNSGHRPVQPDVSTAGLHPANIAKIPKTMAFDPSVSTSVPWARPRRRRERIIRNWIDKYENFCGGFITGNGAIMHHLRWAAPRPARDVFLRRRLSRGRDDGNSLHGRSGYLDRTPHRPDRIQRTSSARCAPWEYDPKHHAVLLRNQKAFQNAADFAAVQCVYYGGWRGRESLEVPVVSIPAGEEKGFSSPAARRKDSSSTRA